MLKSVNLNNPMLQPCGSRRSERPRWLPRPAPAAPAADGHIRVASRASVPRRRWAGADVVRRRGRKASNPLVPRRAKDEAALRPIVARRGSHVRPTAATRWRRHGEWPPSPAWSGPRARAAAAVVANLKDHLNANLNASLDADDVEAG